jgi:hypothetical protein
VRGSIKEHDFFQTKEAQEIGIALYKFAGGLIENLDGRRVLISKTRKERGLGRSDSRVCRWGEAFQNLRFRDEAQERTGTYLPRF